MQNLGHKKVIVIQKELMTAGHHPLLVITDDYCVYYLKAHDKKDTDFKLINEFLASEFLSIWQIHTPQTASLLLNIQNHNFNLSQFYNNKDLSKTCFGSLQIENHIDLNEFFTFRKKVDFRKIINPEDVLKIGLFDIWVENIDRHQGNMNLILQPDNDGILIYAIDHSYIFGTRTDHNFLNPTNELDISFNDSILETELGKNIWERVQDKSKYIAEMRDNFYFWTDLCGANFDNICNIISEDVGFLNNHKNKVFNFLFDYNRNKRVFEEWQRRLL